MAQWQNGNMAGVSDTHVRVSINADLFRQITTALQVGEVDTDLIRQSAVINQVCKEWLLYRQADSTETQHAIDTQPLTDDEPST